MSWTQKKPEETLAEFGERTVKLTSELTTLVSLIRRLQMRYGSDRDFQTQLSVLESAGLLTAEEQSLLENHITLSSKPAPTYEHLSELHLCISKGDTTLLISTVEDRYHVTRRSGGITVMQTVDSYTKALKVAQDFIS